MHTVLENLEMAELGGVGVAEENEGIVPSARRASGRCEPAAEAGRWLGAGSQVQAASTPGRNGGLTPPARQEDGRQEIDESVVFPGDHAIDDPALLEMRPARPQREIDLEALDYQLQGYSVRQIAKLQDVHPNTAFNRISRGREIDAKDPLRAEGASLHAQANKLRQLERAFLPAAEEGDFRSAQLVLRIMDKLWRLGKFARETQQDRRMSPSVAAVSPPPTTMGVGLAQLPQCFGKIRSRGHFSQIVWT